MEPPERREPTPREADLQRQVTDLRASLQRQRADYERQLLDLRRRPDGIAQQVRDAETACRNMKGRISVLERKLLQAKHRIEDDTVRLSAAAQRREEAYKVLTVLVAAEGNAALSDAEYDARIDACVRIARTLLALEQSASSNG